MNKIWLVTKYEYLKHVKKKRFILAILSLPFFILLMVGVGFLSVVIQFDNTPIGYVDNTGILDNPIDYEFEAPLGFMKPMELYSFNNLETATKELEKGTIQAVYLLEDDFIESNTISVYANEIPDSSVNNDFFDFLRANLLKNTDASIVNRITEGAKFEVRSTEDDRNTGDENILGIVLPFLSGFLFIMAINTSGGYLLQAVVEEKENRTMEIVITSVTPTQLMTGKTIGNISVGLTQLIVWLIFAWIGLAVAGNFWPFLQDFSIPGDTLLLMALMFLPAFVMIAAIMATIGAIMTDMREAQQVSSGFSLLVTIPFYVVTPIMMNPNGALAIVLSYFPFSAPITVLLRMAFTTLPAWEITLNILILVIVAVFTVWLAGRAFRMGMLQYGKKITLKELFGKRETV